MLLTLLLLQGEGVNIFSYLYLSAVAPAHVQLKGLIKFRIKLKKTKNPKKQKIFFDFFLQKFFVKFS